MSLFPDRLTSSCVFGIIVVAFGDRVIWQSLGLEKNMKYSTLLTWLVVFVALGTTWCAEAEYTPYQTAVIGDGAVVYYPMEDTTGTAVDFGSSHTNGTYSGTLTGMFAHPSATTFLGNAVAFNGAGSEHNRRLAVGSGR